jgi:hypothetical protein
MVMGQRLVRYLVAGDRRAPVVPQAGQSRQAGVHAGWVPADQAVRARRRLAVALLLRRRHVRDPRCPRAADATARRRGHERRARRPTSGPKSCIRCADAAAAVISCGRMLLGRLTGDTATFREISAKHWHRPALVFNGREEDTFEIKFAQLSERTAGRAHPGDRRPLVLRLATGWQSREALAAPGAIRNNEHSG